MNTPAVCQHAMHSAMTIQGDPPACCYAAAERNSIEVEFWILTHLWPKKWRFLQKNSKIASL